MSSCSTSSRSNRISDSIRAAADAVAIARGFDGDWLNDRAAGFAPLGLHEAECALTFEHPRLRVYSRHAATSRNRLAGRHLAVLGTRMRVKQRWLGRQAVIGFIAALIVTSTPDA